MECSDSGKDVTTVVVDRQSEERYQTVVISAAHRAVS